MMCVDLHTHSTVVYQRKIMCLLYFLHTEKGVSESWDQKIDSNHVTVPQFFSQASTPNAISQIQIYNIYYHNNWKCR